MNGNDSVTFDKTKVECYNYHKRGYFVRECRAPMGHDNRSRDVTRKTVPVEIPNSSALVSCDGLGGYDWSDQAEEGPTNYAPMAYSTSSASSSDSKGLGCNAVPPPHTGLFPPLKSDLSSTGLEELFNEPKTKKSKYKSTDVKPESVRKDSDAPIIKDWVSDDEEEEVNTAKPKATVNAAKAKAKHNAIKGKMGNAVKALTYYEEIDGGYVSFGGNPKGGKITSKGTKDETNGTLKSFITRVENLMNLKVKVIRCDNGTEFKNREMNQFYEVKARTMLADSKLPTTFWAEAVNTACYVQNRILVTKPHNKTPYELVHGRTPAISFLRPFGCPITILNTIDHLGKFDGKADEGFFVRYSLTSSGPNLLFDIDALTKTMNYQPVVAQSNDFSGIKASNDAGKEKEPDRIYILLPL
uniref:Uncharacterized protein n=1 Tax=Tanacetum cinerariifolium TaxID=118510 RepID=A0A699JG89_TANCI|nr:hypothetical protein [Tanacetum cinerariifolium]